MQTNKWFYTKFVLGMFCVFCYYLYNYSEERIYVGTVETLTNELNVTAISEPYYWFALNVQRELFNDPTMPITNQDSF